MVSKTDEMPAAASVPKCEPVELSQEGERADSKEINKKNLKECCPCGK